VIRRQERDGATRVPREDASERQQDAGPGVERAWLDHELDAAVRHELLPRDRGAVLCDDHEDAIACGQELRAFDGQLQQRPVPDEDRELFWQIRAVERARQRLQTGPLSTR